MIAIDPCRDFYHYQKRLTENPDNISYFFRIPESPYTHQYHASESGLFGAVFDRCNNFLKYLPKIDLN